MCCVKRFISRWILSNDISLATGLPIYIRSLIMKPPPIRFCRPWLFCRAMVCSSTEWDILYYLRCSLCLSSVQVPKIVTLRVASPGGTSSCADYHEGVPPSGRVILLPAGAQQCFLLWIFLGLNSYQLSSSTLRFYETRSMPLLLLGLHVIFAPILGIWLIGEFLQPQNCSRKSNISIGTSVLFIQSNHRHDWSFPAISGPILNAITKRGFGSGGKEILQPLVQVIFNGEDLVSQCFALRQRRMIAQGCKSGMVCFVKRSLRRPGQAVSGGWCLRHGVCSYLEGSELDHESGTGVESD